MLSHWTIGHMLYCNFLHCIAGGKLASGLTSPLIFILFCKAVSLAKANRFEEAFVEIRAILAMNLNHLANQGLVLKFTVRFLFFFF